MSDRKCIVSDKSVHPSNRCYCCGVGPVTGQSYCYRGIAIKKGGIGLKITGKTKRVFAPNLQRIKIKTPNTTVKTVKVCTRCIRSGKVQKA